MAPGGCPVVHPFDRYAQNRGLAIVFASREPRAICGVPETSDEFRIPRGIAGTRHDEIVMCAADRDPICGLAATCTTFRELRCVRK